MATKAVIQVKDMEAGYGGTTILSNVSFEVYEGEIFGILGGSGCGKSTLLKHLIGLYPPRAGEIIIDGDSLIPDDPETYKRILRKIGVLYQSGALLGSLTVGENVALPIREYTDLTPAAIDAMVKMKLGLVHLDGYEHHYPAQLSGGMKKRAGLARAMALNPRILFFDEPSAGLDPISAAELDQLILRLNKGFRTTMVIVTHELASIFAVLNRVILLDKQTKGIIAIGSPAELQGQSTDLYVKSFFNRRPLPQE